MIFRRFIFQAHRFTQSKYPIPEAHPFVGTKARLPPVLQISLWDAL